MTNMTRTVLIALGVALLAVGLVPLLFMTGVMGGGMRDGGAAQPPGRRRPSAIAHG